MNDVDMTASARAVIDAFDDPCLGSLGALKAVTGLTVTPAETRVSLRLPIPVQGYAPQLQAALQAALARAGLAQPVVLDLTSDIPARAVQKPLKPMPGIRNIIAVGSAKGGVGKSTVAANLALAWAAMGARVGLLDADIYGPSQPLLLGVAGQRPQTVDSKRILPLQAHGVKLMSIGLLIDAGQPAIWRGPMVTQALTQLLADTEWGELDFLVIDLPPGTGDLQLTLAQKVPVAGAVVVTTPQEIAVADARKGLRMFEKMSVAVLGVVENMSTHLCSNCGHEDAIFGDGGGVRLAEECGVALLAKLPLDTRVRAESDSGRPTVVAAPESPRGQAYFELARRTAAELARRAAGSQQRIPGNRRGESFMTIKSDHWIRRMAAGHGMIEPFEPGQVRDTGSGRIVSYGTSSYGYDVRCAREFKIFTNINSTIVDPKNFDPQSFVDVASDVCIIPPNSFALARTVEYFRIPRNVLVVCLGKSTYARCGIIVNVTPLEPEWEGHVTLEFSNTTPLPAKIYANEGVAQMLFFESDEICGTSYKDRGGKYQGQQGVTLPKA